jgi:YVTN family beta-propeller protein
MGLVKRTRAMGACVAVALLMPASALAAPAHAYVTNNTGTPYGSVSAFAIGAGGKLASPGPPFAPFNTHGPYPFYLAVSPNGKYMYVANDATSGSVSQFLVNRNGTLTDLSLTPVPAGMGPQGIAISPNGQHVYVANEFNNTVSIFDVMGNGTLAPNGTQATFGTNLQSPWGVALSPDGNSLYVTNYLGAGHGTVAEFTVAGDGTLSAKATPTVSAGQYPVWISFTPNGKYAYVANYGTIGDSHATVSQYTVGPGGELSAHGSPVNAGAPGQLLFDDTVSPNGKSLYAPNNSSVYQFTIGATGQLTAKSPASAHSAAGAQYIWLTADGKNAYTANDAGSSSSLSEYNVGATGLLTPKATPTLGGQNNTAALVIPPDQGPVASFTDTPKPAGSATSFNASASHDADGKVVQYTWSFGNGATLHTAKPTISETYKKAGNYTVTLTVTDDGGCSTRFTFTGTTAYCNGSPAAQVKKTITIP